MNDVIEGDRLMSIIMKDDKGMYVCGYTLIHRRATHRASGDLPLRVGCIWRHIETLCCRRSSGQRSLAAASLWQRFPSYTMQEREAAAMTLR